MTTTEAAADPQAARGKGDWVLAAAMLAEGRGVMETARAAGVCRTSLWRALNKSADFVRLIERRRAELAAESGGRLDALRALVAGQIEDKVRDGDTRTLLWLARELGMAGGNTVLFGRMETPAVKAEPDLAKIERVASGEDARAHEPWASAAPEDGPLSETARELAKAKQGIAYFREKLERTRQELDALKKAVAAGSLGTQAVNTIGVGASLEPDEKAVPTVPNQGNRDLNQLLSLERTGSNSVPIPFQTVPPKPAPAPRL